MYSSGTLFLQTSVYQIGIRIFRQCQEIGNPPAHGRQRRSLVSGLSETLSATIAGAWHSTKTLLTGIQHDSPQVHIPAPPGTSYPQRRAVRKPQTHVKTCQTQTKATPHNRETAVAAAHAEGRNAATIITTATTPKAASKTAANPAAETAPAAKTLESLSAARCQHHLPNSPSGRSY